ncbi:hypothetical protein B0H13DRAFT_2678932 [Mycena leptocephala]|nr:hypothetical protein B0H13DRAFT_2678932 [Mycena leptocephala]
MTTGRWRALSGNILLMDRRNNPTDQVYVLSACVFYSLLFLILPRRYNPTTSAPPPLRLPSVSSILTDTDTANVIGVHGSGGTGRDWSVDAQSRSFEALELAFRIGRAGRDAAKSLLGPLACVPSRAPSSVARAPLPPPTAEPVLYTDEYLLFSFAPPFNPMRTRPADNDTYFPRTTRRARLGGIGPEVVEVGSGSDKFLSRDFSQRTHALAGVKRGARSYSIHFSRASPPSPLPGPALLAPAILPFLRWLLSVIILLTHFKDTLLSSRALDAYGNGLGQTPNKRPSFPFFGCIGVLMHRLGCAAAGTVRVRALVWGIFPEFPSRVRGCLATQRDIGVDGEIALAAAARVLIPYSPLSFLLPSADDPSAFLPSPSLSTFSSVITH